jgi:hypothetical protein
MPNANRKSVCTLINYQWCGGICFVDAAVSKDGCLPQIPRRGGVSHYGPNQCFVEG